MYAVRALASRISSEKSTPIIVNCLNPGWVITDVMREWTGLRLFIFNTIRSMVGRKTEVGARTLIAAAQGGQETHGEYMDDCKVGK